MMIYTCQGCSIAFEYDGPRPRQYCSRTCSNRVHNQARSQATPRLTKPCEVCGAAVAHFPGRADRARFCSRACKGEARRGKPSNHTLVHGNSGTGRTGFRPDLDQFFRSRWEANYARYLRHIKATYAYEPERFTIALPDGTTHGYTPDFLVNGTHYVEIKGWMRPERRQAEVIRAAQHQLPKPLMLLSKDSYDQLTRQYGKVIEGWEHLGDPNPELPKRLCPTCGTVVTSIFRQTKYCSRACFGASGSKPKIPITCQTCGKHMEVPPWDANRVYCSRKCFGVGVSKANKTRARTTEGRFA